MLSFLLMALGYGWAVLGFVSVLSYGGDLSGLTSTSTGEAMLLSFTLLSHLICYWIPGITVGLIGTIGRYKSPPRRLT